MLVFENVQVDVEDNDRLCADTLLAGGEVQSLQLHGFVRIITNICQ